MADRITACDVVETSVFEIELRLSINVFRRLSSRDLIGSRGLATSASGIFFRFLLDFTSCGVFDSVFKREMEDDVIARRRKLTLTVEAYICMQSDHVAQPQFSGWPGYHIDF
jgi:hypothetical protein